MSGNPGDSGAAKQGFASGCVSVILGHLPPPPGRQMALPGGVSPDKGERLRGCGAAEAADASAGDGRGSSRWCLDRC